MSIFRRRTPLLILVMATYGCTDAADPPLPVELQAEIILDEGTIDYTLFATNFGAEHVVLTQVCSALGMAWASLRVYEAVDGANPVWDERLTHIRTCITPSSIPVMAGEQSLVFSKTLSMASILGDSIPPGTYHLAVQGQFEPELPVMEVIVGEFLLQ